MTSQQTNQLLALRPVILTEAAESIAEKFQNETLRPILKLQNTLLLKASTQQGLYSLVRQSVIRDSKLAARLLS